MIQALIFDFDGVLILGDASRFQAIRQIAATNNIAIPEASYPHLIGRTTLQFLTDTIPDIDPTTLQNILAAYEDTYNRNIIQFVRPIPMVIAFIKAYEGDAKLALATMSSRKKTETLLRHFGIFEKFQSIICKEDVCFPKPHPEIYEKTAEALGVLPQNCVVIEDTPLGVEAAIGAWMRCFVLLNPVNQEKEFAHSLIKGFIRTQADLEQLMKHH